MTVSYRYIGAVSVILAVTIALSSVLFINSQQSQFQMWKAQHKGTFSFQSQFQEQYRKMVFIKNLQTIKKHNEDPSQTYKMASNQFMIYTTQEFKDKFFGLRLYELEAQFTKDLTDTVRGVQIDWVAKGAVTPIKNQGDCGSCWAFSAVGGCEGLSKIADGALLTFSEQQLVDCSSTYGNSGCNGGLTTNAYKFVKDHGLTPSVNYPYTGKVGDCKIKEGTFKIKDFKVISNCDVLAIQIQIQPISVAVDASNWSFYASGIFNNCRQPYSLNHGVLAVGVTDTYWKVKNSWGMAWGQNGYIRLARGNQCGLCNFAAYPIK